MSILVAGVLVAGALVYNVGSGDLAVSGDEVDEGDLVASVGEVLGEATRGRVVLGDANAPVTWVEFSDYQCPFCGKLALESGEQLREEYIKTGKVKMVLVDLAFLGPESVQAARAAHCAGDQNKYWTYHDKLFSYIWDNYYAKGKNGENVGAFSDDNLKLFAEELELDVDEFDACFDWEMYTDVVDSGYNYAQEVLGDKISTPSVFINGELIQGAQPYNVFKKVIDEELDALSS